MTLAGSLVGIERVVKIRKRTEQDVQFVRQLAKPERRAAFCELEDVRRVFSHMGKT
jgi:hypothetical protein